MANRKNADMSLFVFAFMGAKLQQIRETTKNMNNFYNESSENRVESRRRTFGRNFSKHSFRLVFTIFSEFTMRFH